MAKLSPGYALPKAPTYQELPIAKSLLSASAHVLNCHSQFASISWWRCAAVES